MKKTSNKKALSIIASIMIVVFIIGKMHAAYNEYSSYLSNYTWVAFSLSILLYIMMKLGRLELTGGKKRILILIYIMLHSFFLVLIWQTTKTLGFFGVSINYFVYVLIELISELWLQE